ncbi:MAG: potassium uptake system protein [bacterium (Candidatus Stahlbacteria) CG23_combo_of_CG06-09_8_20_14_all_34_7]|nr:MAG: potassium uptake system protein [bacterium (Candidatus Stahlbacteria) CG23_combo_of_CG06-09_8_20_14_all_34_7]
MDKKKENVYAVIGLGSFGNAVASLLSEKGIEVLAIDADEDRVENIVNKVAHAVQMNATNEQSLKEIGMEDVHTAIVSVGDDIASSLLICTYLKDTLKIKRVIAKATDQKHARVLEKIGVDRIIFPEYESAKRLADSLISPNIFDMIELSDKHNIVEIKASSTFWGRTLEEIDIRKRFDVNIIAIKRNVPMAKEGFTNDFDEITIISPSPKEQIVEGDVLVMIGIKEHLENIEKI